jgi:hypothetical protein
MRLFPPAAPVADEVFAAELGGPRYGFAPPSDADGGDEGRGSAWWWWLWWRTKRRLRWVAWRSRCASRCDAARRQSVRSGRKRR